MENTADAVTAIKKLADDPETPSEVKTIILAGTIIIEKLVTDIGRIAAALESRNA